MITSVSFYIPLSGSDARLRPGDLIISPEHPLTTLIISVKFTANEIKFTVVSQTQIQAIQDVRLAHARAAKEKWEGTKRTVRVFDLMSKKQ